MKYSLLFKDDFKKVVLLHWGHFMFLMIGLLLEFLNQSFGFRELVKVIFVLIFYKLFFKTLRNLYYTYWSFSFILLVYLLAGIIQSVFILEVPGITYSYFLSLLCLIIEAFFLSSPIYYPRVSWWEYDFRYRPEIKIFVKVNGKKVNGRLTDIRRNAGCIILFDHLEENSLVNIFLENEESFEVLVMSKRHYSVGRGIKYGVQFNLDNKDLKDNYYNLMKSWREETISKRKSKFVQENG